MKIDVSGIEGFAEMTAEQKVEALQNFEYDDGADKYEKLKKSFDTLSHEHAELKKQHRDKMTEDEKKAEADKALQEELEGYRKAQATRDLEDSYLELYEGMDRATAKKIASTEDVKERNKLLADYVKDRIKKAEEKARNNDPDPHAGHGGGGGEQYKPSKTRATSSIDMEKYSKFTKQK